MKMQTKKLMSTSRDAGIAAGHSVHGRSEPVRPPMVSDVATMNVKEFDVFCPGKPRPFVAVHNFGSAGFSHSVPPVVTGRGRS